jgi:hypothetical protein
VADQVLAVDRFHSGKRGGSDDPDNAIVFFQFNGGWQREPLG